jgi:hypothetical protein
MVGYWNGADVIQFTQFEIVLLGKFSRETVIVYHQ